MQTSLSPRNDSERTGVGLAKGLGWFSLGLGVAELAAPQILAKLIGVENDPRSRLIMRLFGAREVAAGLGIFARPKHPAGTVNRLVGDALDIGALVWALSSRKHTSVQRLTLALASVATVTALDALATKRLAKSRKQSAQPVTRTITINKSPLEVYAEWRDFSKLPRFMSYVEAVDVRSSRQSHWVVNTAVGRVSWHAEIHEDVPGKRIAWHTLPGTKVPHSGAVTFKLAPDGRRTEVVVEFQIAPVGWMHGGIGDAVGKLLAGSQIEGDLRRFKQVIETGELVRSDASIHPGMHPARPSEEKGA